VEKFKSGNFFEIVFPIFLSGAKLVDVFLAL